MFEQEICEHFLKRTPWDAVPKKFKKKTKISAGGWGGYNHNLQPPDGTPVLIYEERCLRSYAHWDMAWFTEDGKTVIVNGDASPSMRTTIQRDALFRAIRSLGIQHTTVPFSTLRAANLVVKNLRVLDIKPDFSLEHKRVIKGEVVTKVRHFLGECLLEDERHRAFLSGLDRNDDPQKRMYYLCRLPTLPFVKTVDEALESLRPDYVRVGTPRQGEWFFVPQPGLKLKSIGKYAIVSDMADGQWNDLRRLHSRRHVASSLALYSGGVYVKGTVTDAEHSMLRLGGVWHKVEGNRAIQGWRYEGKGGARVD